MCGKGADDAWNVMIGFEYGFGHGILVQIDVGEVLVLPAAELFKDVCLAYLTCAVKNKWLVVPTRLPLK